MLCSRRWPGCDHTKRAPMIRRDPVVDKPWRPGDATQARDGVIVRAEFETKVQGFGPTLKSAKSTPRSGAAAHHTERG